MKKLIPIVAVALLSPLTVIAASYSVIPSTTNSAYIAESTSVQSTQSEQKKTNVNSKGIADIQAPLIKAYIASYKVDAEASGELRKKLSYQGDQVNLKSQLKASKLFVDVTISQNEKGRLGKNGLIAESLVINNSRNNGPEDFKFANGEMGNLSAIYVLRDSLLHKASALPSINLLRKNNFEKLNFKIVSKDENISTNLGDISSTKVEATASNGDVLTYWFANDNAKYNGVMTQMTERNSDGDQKLFAVLKNFQLS